MRATGEHINCRELVKFAMQNLRSRIHIPVVGLHACGNRLTFVRVPIQRVTTSFAFLCSSYESKKVHPEMRWPHLK